MLKYENSNGYMEEIIQIGKKLAPELNEIFPRRYEILRQIEKNQPIGRRSLSQILEIGERIVRSEVNILKEQGFIEIHSSGMNTTEFGKNSLGVLKDFVYDRRKLHDLEDTLKDKLNVRKVLIVMDSYDEDESVIKEVGKTAANYLKSILTKEMIIGITGGKTMQMVAEGVSSENNKNKNVVVVPGRGGLGRSVEKQSNTIAATLAEKLKASYRLLHVSDNISKELIDKLIKDPYIKEVVEYIKKIETLIFGIGRADKMANNRGTEVEKIENIIKKGAVAEAFGYYFDKNGEIVEEVNTIGVSLNHYKELEHPIGAACGNQKAEAIIAISKLNKNLVLVIDEGLAKEIFKKI